VETASFDRPGYDTCVELSWQLCCRLYDRRRKGYALRAPDLAGPTDGEPSVPRANQAWQCEKAKPPSMWAALTASTVIGRKHALPRWADMDRCIAGTPEYDAPARAGSGQLPVATHLRIQIGDETTTRHVRCRPVMESTLSQRAVRMERIGTFRLQFFDYHLNVLDADL
jgi:hypothetical protein